MKKVKEIAKEFETSPREAALLLINKFAFENALSSTDLIRAATAVCFARAKDRNENKYSQADLQDEVRRIMSISIDNALKECR